MTFTSEDKKAFFDRLGKIELTLAEISAKLRGTDKDVGTLNARGCEHGVRRYEDLNKRLNDNKEFLTKEITASKNDMLNALDKGLKNYKTIGGIAGTLGLIGGVFLKEFFSK